MKAEDFPFCGAKSPLWRGKPSAAGKPSALTPGRRQSSRAARELRPPLRPPVRQAAGRGASGVLPWRLLPVPFCWFPTNLGPKVCAMSVLGPLRTIEQDRRR